MLISRRQIATWATGIAVLAGVLTPALAVAGSAHVNPANCGTGDTWGYKDFNVAGSILREELRHGYGCGGVGWGRLTRVGGTSQSLALIQTSWNPGGPSQDGVPGTNYTYTVDASRGREVCAGFQAYRVDGLGRWNHIGWYFAGCYRA